MPWRRRVISLCRTLFGRGGLERDLEDELHACLDELVARNVRSGLTPEQARREALVELGGIEQLKEEIRRRRVGQEIVTTARDVRVGARLLARSPGFAIVALLTLALGIGATVTVFSVVHAVLWRPLPYPDADRLVIVRVDARGVANAGATAGEILDLRTRSRSLAAVETINGVDAHVSVDGGHERVAAASVSDGVLPMLGALPLPMGRTLRAAEDVGERWVRSVVISDDLWRRRFGADPAALGRRLQVNNLDVQIVGILPPGFRVFLPPETLAAESIDVWFPTSLSGNRDDQRGHPLIARLQPGASAEQAQAELDALAAQFVAEHAPAYPGGALRLSVHPLRDAVTGEIQPALLALGGAVAFVLLIACVNVANLLLARGQGRAREMGVRRALGATRGRLVRQLLAESVVLAAGGAAGGLLLAHLGVDLLDWLRPSHLPRQSEIAVDATVVLFTVALSGATTLILGVLPALRLTSDPGSAFLNSGRADTGVPAVRRLQRALVIMEVAFSIVPLVAAGLMLRTFVNLTQAPIGFQPANVVTASVPFSPSRFRDPQQRQVLFREILQRVGQLPGVESVSAASPLPFGPWQITRRYGKDADPAAPMSPGTLQSTLPGYLRIMGITLREGRDFSQADVDARSPVVIVDERIARQLWPEGAVGKRLIMQVGSSGRSALEVIGVTNPVRVTRVRDAGTPHFFVPYHIYSIQMSLVIRSRESAATLAPAIERAIEPLGTGRAVFDIRPMSDYVANSIGDTRFILLVLLGFACASLLLAAVGIHGTLAYLVSQRTKELGVRAALGAPASELVGIVVREAAALAAAGGALGAAGAVAVNGFLRGLLYEVTPFDAPTIGMVGLVMAVAAVLAAARPAWRVAHLDPTSALRQE